MRAVITGAAGFIGTHLTERLVRDGAAITGLDDQRTGDWNRLRATCERVERDLAELSRDDLADLLRDADVLFHLAAEKYNSSKATPARVVEVNVAATQRLYWAAATAQVPVVFTSSLYAYGSLGPAPMSEIDVPRPTTVYGASKLMGEHLLRAAERELGLRWAVARLFFVYGPRQYAEGGYKSVIVKNFERLRAGMPPVVVGDGEQRLDYVYVDDVVTGLLRLAEADAHGTLVNLGSGHGVSINELTAAMNAVAGYEGPIETAPPDWTAGSARVGDVKLAARQLGWRPGTQLDEGLARVWASLDRDRESAE